METGNNQVEADSLVVVDIQVLADSQAVMDNLVVMVESPAEEDIQDILGSLHMADILDTSQMHILQTINHGLLLTECNNYYYCYLHILVKLIQNLVDIPLPQWCDETPHWQHQPQWQ